VNVAMGEGSKRSVWLGSGYEQEQFLGSLVYLTGKKLLNKFIGA